MARVIELYDTTLRDGTQAENFNLSVDDKIKVCRQLDRIGIDFIEGGWPGSNPLAVDFFKRMQGVELKQAKLAAFGSTRHFHKKPEDDANLQALLAARTPAVTIFGKSWDIHVIDALRIELEDNLQLIEDSLAYLRPRVQHLIYDAEHFFDGFKNNREYCLATLGKAIAGGAETIVLCDTNGGTLPHEIPEIVQRVMQYRTEQGSQVRIGIHAHNDSETGVANALMCVHTGATHVQGTVNGFGERCGNANLTSIIPALVFKMGLECKVGKRIDQLYTTARTVNELANLPHNRYQPYVGESAFAHKGGIHVSAVQRNPMTYEHIAPEKVGNARRVLISDQSGKANVLMKAQKYGLNIDQDDPAMAAIVNELKNLENQGYQYEAAEASFELLMRRAMGLQREFFQLEAFRVLHHNHDKAKQPITEATIRLYVNDSEVHTASMGEGPVNALDRALRKALIRFYPNLEEMDLTDYKVRVLTGEHGTGAKVRVLVESKDMEESWGTVGVSVNIIEASWQALVDSINYKLMKDEKHRC
ncbi:citramalate synthase [Desulfobulbus sp.]|uniref:citramalate synthase n=1 Tax=Desulfobulbus sp. TaxID=895 RepID=UPI00286F192D|nr:citramalate synthase [Desulfobulbus sp.]